MYSYTYDKKTGGILLNSSPNGFSKEPRPVYAAELDVLGFNKYWKYDKQTDYPYMWAEANSYFYRGMLVAKLKGGNTYTAPEIIIPNGEDGAPIMPEPEGMPLCPIDINAMVAANREMLEIIERSTVKKILAVYTKYKNKLDCFHVAFSGGKDSCVLLDLVRKALPKGSFVVVFGDTGMEFPDTYDVIEKIKKQCSKNEIPFYVARSHLEPKESWELFGPPSRVLRWCCSVHKSTPQVLKLREITGKNDYTGLAFVGVRAQESATRAEYDYESYGKKQKGQYSHNSILEWTSAEVWLYVYANGLIINEAYKKGSARVGCICCPMGGSKASFVEHVNYPQKTEVFISRIRNSNERSSITPQNYVANGGWNARRNGCFLSANKISYLETIRNGEIVIEISDPKTAWKEWIKTLGSLFGEGERFFIIFFDKEYRFSVEPTKTGYNIKIAERDMRDNRLFGKLFRQVFRKAAYCLGCKTCQAACKFGCISFVDGRHTIKDCRHCFECFSMSAGCLAYDSRKIPQGKEIKMKTINCFANHAPKTEWLNNFFEQKSKFLLENSLGPVQQTKFKRFLKDSDLISQSEITPFAELGTSLGWNTDTYMALVLVNLAANNPQIKWYIQTLDIAISYKRKEIEDILSAEGQSRDNTLSIVHAYKRLVETPLGTSLHFGFVTDNGDLVRTKCSISDNRVVLYGLYKFAEKCNDYKEFTLSVLLNDNIDRDGISPTRIFGLSREEMIPILNGLSAKYSDFINVSFTYDLEKITLAKDKSSADVLDLFKEENANA